MSIEEIDKEDLWVRQPDGSYGTAYNDTVVLEGDNLKVERLEVSSDEPLKIPIHVLGAVLARDGWVLLKKETFLKATNSSVVESAKKFIELRKKGSSEPAENVASHRRLHLSVEQFDAYVALGRAVDEMSLTDEEERGIQAIIYLQGIIGIEETRQDAFIGWRRMSPANHRQTMMAYEAVKAQEAAHAGAKR